MFLTLFLLAILLIIYHQIRAFRYFSSHASPGPQPSFFFGNLRQLWNCQSISRQLQLWTKKYGSIYGFYEGAYQRIWVVSDIKFLEDVFIRKYSIFTSRKPVALFLNPNEKYPSLLNAKGEKWKRQRKVMNTIFSTMKLKDLFPLMNVCVTHFLSKLPATRADLNIYEFYKNLTFDIICFCCYGFQSSSEEYYRKVEEMFAIDITRSPWLKLTALLGSSSFLSQLIEKIYRLQDDFKRYLNEKQNFLKLGEFPRYWLRERIREIVDRAIKGSDEDGRSDLVHLLLKAAKKDDLMSHGEILQNVSAFLVAGYETTASTMAYSTYILATHPEEQLKLQMEIDSQEDVKEMSYDIVTKKFEYLDRFVREVLRMYPVAIQQISRQCEQETMVTDESGKEFEIKKGDIVQADVFSLHYSADLWGPTDPALFYPDRHLTQQSQSAFLAFGLGPRQCIGVRFAMSVIKLTLIRLLKEYTMVQSNKLEENWCLNERRVITPENCWIRLEKRQ